MASRCYGCEAKAATPQRIDFAVSWCSPFGNVTCTFAQIAPMPICVGRFPPHRPHWHRLAMTRPPRRRMRRGEREMKRPAGSPRRRLAGPCNSALARTPGMSANTTAPKSAAPTAPGRCAPGRSAPSPRRALAAATVWTSLDRRHDAAKPRPCSRADHSPVCEGRNAERKSAAAASSCRSPGSSAAARCARRICAENTAAVYHATGDGSSSSPANCALTRWRAASRSAGRTHRKQARPQTAAPPGSTGRWCARAADHRQERRHVAPLVPHERTEARERDGRGARLSPIARRAMADRVNQKSALTAPMAKSTWPPRRCASRRDGAPRRAGAAADATRLTRRWAGGEEEPPPAHVRHHDAAEHRPADARGGNTVEVALEARALARRHELAGSAPATAPSARRAESLQHARATSCAAIARQPQASERR